MALTAEGRALTDVHRRQQVAIGARAAAASSLLWPELDVADLDRSTPAWLAANTRVAEIHFEESRALAAPYVSQYRAAELGADVGTVTQARFDHRLTAQALNLAGPVRVKLLVGRGMPPSTAHGAALAKFNGIMRRQTLAGGRETLDLTTRDDRQAIGWRRVTDGDPCTFCAMLASRGPVYRSKATAGNVIPGDGLEYHGSCGCTAELVYGEWQPTESEQRYIDEYNKAAEEASSLGLPRTRQNVLPRMRTNGTFRDSPLTRNTKTTVPPVGGG